MTATVDTVTSSSANPAESEFELVPFDIYKDIHKGIRGELFRVTALAGTIDPGERCAREGLAETSAKLFELLVEHANHEDDYLQPSIELHAPFFAEVIASDHARLEARIAQIQAQVERAATARSAEQRGRVHHVYRELASFTSAYLEHQDFEERQVMPALANVMGVDEVLAIDHAIVASLSPDQSAWALSVMLPAMNIEDRVEMLADMQAGAPPEVFTGVWALAGSILPPADYQALGTRLGIS